MEHFLLETALDLKIKGFVEAGDYLFEKSRLFTKDFFIKDIILSMKTIKDNNCFILGTFFKKEVYLNILISPEQDYFRLIHSYRQINLYNPLNTGTCGLHGLLWVKSELINVINWISNLKKIETIIIDPNDEQRDRIYKRFLIKLGFIYSLEDEHYILKIKREMNNERN